MSKPDQRMALISCFKNERHILYEWVHHHLDEGFDKIYLINNDSTDNFEICNPWLKELEKEGRIILENARNRLSSNEISRISKINSEVKRVVSQHTQDFLALIPEIKENFDIVCILDMDEFIYTPHDKSIKDVFLENPNVEGFLIYWGIFAHNQVYQPKSVIQNNIYTHNTKKYPGAVGTRAISRTKNLLGLSAAAHSHFFQGNRNIQHLYVHNNILRINHYRSQSDQYVIGVKQKNWENFERYTNYAEKYKKEILPILNFKDETLLIKKSKTNFINFLENEYEQVFPDSKEFF